ncbi:MAG TPA: hypothetical protein VFS67_32445 [Polyangiaceae bacterium]|nr:hypothetical protein [Polyangiaceae bacterium]
MVRGLAGVQRILQPIGAALAVFGSARAALALEPRSLTEPAVLQQPATVTNVVDAFDEGSGIDLHFSLGYQHTWKRAGISRETNASLLADAGLPLLGASGGKPRFHVADFSETTSRLNVRAELGLYHDLALIVRLPVILARSSTLSGPELPAGALDGAPGEPLFSVPFSSPNRSGVEFLGIGVDWGILNQFRDAAQPTLTVGAEARLSISEPMHACGESRPASDTETGQVRCADPSDVNRDGAGGQFPVQVAPGRIEPLEGNFSAASRKAGVSRGSTGLELHGAISRRFAQLEPYLGLGVLLELPNEDSDFGPDRWWKEGIGARAGVSLGAEFMPWEVVEQFQRLSVDLRFTGTYSAAGRDYSELFDALGSSSAPSFRRPSYAGYLASDGGAVPSVIDPDSERVYPTGITNVQAHGAYALRLFARWQAGRYVRFDVGGGWALTQRHVITMGSPCDPARERAVERSGPCLAQAPGVSSEPEPRSLGAPDPSYRPEIEQPGRRFIVDTASTIDAWLGATVMF